MGNNKFGYYQCSVCGTKYREDEVTYVCPKDDGILDVILNYEEISKESSPQDIFASREQSIWRYLPLIPTDDPGGFGTPLRSAGWTPLYAPEKLRKDTGLDKLWIKDESPNPTASFKDRASAVLIQRGKEIEAEVIVTASTGNAGAALAGMAAAVGQKAVIFAPKTAPPAKIAQLIVFGAEVILVDGTYDDAVSLALEASEEFGWYCRNTGYNPFTAEGKKTAAFEMWEQLTVDYKNGALFESGGKLAVFVSVGDGNIISGIHKGFKDLLALGWIDQMPKIFGVQSTGSAAIANAFDKGTETIEAVNATTMADSISVNMPSDGLRALRAATQTGGAYIQVEDADILKMIPVIGAVGIFAEPAGATAYAGMLVAKSKGLINNDDAVVVINTGSGLKDVNAAMRAVKSAPIISPTLEEVKKLLG